MEGYNSRMNKEHCHHSTLEWSLSLSFIRDTTLRPSLLLLLGSFTYLFPLSLNMSCDSCTTMRTFTAIMGPTSVTPSIDSMDLPTRVEALSTDTPDVMNCLRAHGGNRSYSQYLYLYLFSYRVCLPV